MDLAEGVAHFVDNQRKLAVGAMAKIDRQRIEGVAEQARVTQKPHASAIQIDAALGRATPGVKPQARSVALAVIGLVETVERRAVDAEQGRLPVRGVKPVEIDQQAHDAVAEAMPHRLETGMHHLAEIKRGRGVEPIALGYGSGGFIRHRHSAACASSGGGARHGTTAPSASATARPDRNPSSWNP